MTLDDLIIETSMNEEFIRNSHTDFAQSRKLDFITSFNSILSIEGNSLGHEILELFEYNEFLLTTSAFVQAKDKILPSVFSHVFYEFTKPLKKTKKYRYYNLFAVDEFVLNLYRNPNETETFVSQSNNKGCNMMLLTVIYDLCNNFYTDTVTQPYNLNDERGALIELLPNVSAKSIIIIDRGYESYNIFAHLEENRLNYVVRVIDISSNGILSALNISNEEFNKVFTVNVSNFQKKCYNLYQIINFLHLLLDLIF